MKTFFIILLMLVLNGCGTVVKQLNTDCKQTPEELLKSITGLLMLKNFSVKLSDVKLGVLIMETEPSSSFWTPAIVSRKVWQFQYNNNKLIASAKVVTKNSSSEDYYDDTADADLDWYWDIRNELEKLCGQITFKVSPTN